MLPHDTIVVMWDSLEETDAHGRPYRFSVQEVDAEGNDFTPPNYIKSDEYTQTVTNTYVIPTNGTATATKNWDGSDANNRPTVWFKLYRRTDMGNLEAVPGAEIKEVQHGIITVTWDSLEETDAYANPYIFSVREVDAAGNDFAPVCTGKLQ